LYGLLTASSLRHCESPLTHSDPVGGTISASTCLHVTSDASPLDLRAAPRTRENATSVSQTLAVTFSPDWVPILLAFAVAISMLELTWPKYTGDHFTPSVAFWPTWCTSRNPKTPPLQLVKYIHKVNFHTSIHAIGSRPQTQPNRSPSQCLM
jgi:hypothetical protein